MKLINIKNYSEKKIETLGVLKTILGAPAPQGINIAGIRTRVRLLDKLEFVPVDAVSFELEDADHSDLSHILSGHTYGAASRELLAIIDDVLQAKAPPPAVT